MESYFENDTTNEPTSRDIIENNDNVTTADISSKVNTDMEKIVTDAVHDINKNFEINMLALTSAWEKHADSIKERDETIKRLQTNLYNLSKDYDELDMDYRIVKADLHHSESEIKQLESSYKTAKYYVIVGWIGFIIIAIAWMLNLIKN